MFTIFGIAHVARSPGTTINTCSEAVFKMPLCRPCLCTTRQWLLNAWLIILNIYILQIIQAKTVTPHWKTVQDCWK